MLEKIRRKFDYTRYFPLIYNEELRESYLGKSITGGELKGKNVLITGGSGGIGIALALRYIDEGATVFLSGRNQKKIQCAIEYINKKRGRVNIYPLCFDLINIDQAKDVINRELIEKNIRIDILVSNAGFFDNLDRKRVFRTYDSETFKMSWKTNFVGNCNICSYIAEIMNKQGIFGKIIVIDSICAQQKKFQYTPYGMSKTAMADYAKHIQNQYPSISVSTIYPGSVATKMGDFSIGSDISSGCNALNHVILPEEIAAIAAFFSSDISRYIRGIDVIASACQTF